MCVCVLYTNTDRDKARDKQIDLLVLNIKLLSETNMQAQNSSGGKKKIYSKINTYIIIDKFRNEILMKLNPTVSHEIQKH